METVFSQIENFYKYKLMFKYLIFVVIVLTISSTQSGICAQDIKITYEMRQGALGDLPYEELNPIPDFSILANRYTLILSGDKSRFTHDSLILGYVSKTGSYKGRYTHVASYKNLSSSTFVYVNGRMKSDYGISGNTNVIGQEITCRYHLKPEYRTIAGFKCQKSVNCSGNEAWVATNIPYVDGPSSEGIPAPGLVLLYRNNDYEIKAIDVSTGKYKFTIPALNLVDSSNRMEAYRSVQEQMDLGPEEAVIITKDSPTDVWLNLKK